MADVAIALGHVQDDIPRSGARPSWATLLSDAQYVRLMSLVDEEIGRRDVRSGRVGPLVTMYLSDATYVQAALPNLVQYCHRAPEERWPQIVRAYLDTAVRGEELIAESSALARDLGRALPLIRARIQPADMYDPSGWGQFVRRPLALGIVETLVYDLPSQVMNVRAAHVQRFGLADDELRARALANLADAAEPQWEDIALGGELAMRSLRLPGAAFYAASHLLLLDRHVSEAPYGVICFVPTRETLLLHVIKDRHSLDVLRHAVLPALELFKEGPGSLSPYPYWWKDGFITALTYLIRDDAALFFAPDRFRREVLEPLGASPHRSKTREPGRQ